MHKLWTEEYRPNVVADYVFRDNKQKTQVQSWIDSGAIPHLLFSGVQGSGKTTIAKLLLNELKVDPGDILFINASSNNGVDYIRDTITNFTSSMPFGEFKYVLLDESDYLSPNAQAALRGTMERFSNTARFILTCVTGDTKVYTPYGYKHIETVNSSDRIVANDRILDNKMLKISKSADVYEISTKHGYVIKATGNHKFKTIHGDSMVSELSVNDRLPISLSGLYGNEFEYTDSSEFFNVVEFDKFLEEKGILSNAEYDYLDENRKFLFNATHSMIFNYIRENNLGTVNLVELSEKLNVSRSVVRNFLSKISDYICDRKYVTTSTFHYTLDLSNLITDFDKFVCAPGMTELHLRKYQTREDIIRSLPEFDDDRVLSMGRLIGFCEGDGHISTSIHFAANNHRTLELVNDDICKFVDIPLKIRKNGTDSNGLCITPKNKLLYLLLDYFGATFGNKSKTVRSVPCHCQHKLFFRGYIQGLYDADGKQFTINKNANVSPFLITQAIYDKSQISYFEELSAYIKRHLGISTTVRTKVSPNTSTFGGSNTTMFLTTCCQSDILKYLEAVGNYYDKVPVPELIGYIRYKTSETGYNFLRFSEWKEQYYGFGLLNDEITSIKKLDNEYDVYDCSFDEHHWYLTNGFVSHNCNYPHKIIPAIHSRCQGFHIEKLDKNEFTARVATILITESVKFEIETIDMYVDATYPDMRKCINLCQMNSQDGVLEEPNQGDSGESDYKLEMIALFRDRKYKEAREVVCKKVGQEEYESVFRFCYENLGYWAATEEAEMQAIVIIRNGLVKHTSAGDPEINLSATLVELEMLAKEQ